MLASANFFLMCFNLLPAYPLDGGPDARCAGWARCSGRRGRCASSPASAWPWPSAVALYALPTGIFLLFVALFLAQANWEALQSVGGWSRRR